jgi:pSer/pThr/pTyr-binding forkhead associated (FHA) protein
MEGNCVAPEKLYLVFDRKKIRLGDLTFIGRDGSNDIILEDPCVSRKHCFIGKVLGKYVIEDLGSKNGTFVNGRYLEKDDMAILDPGNEITMGETYFSIG